MHRSEKFHYKRKWIDLTSFRWNTCPKLLSIFKTSVVLILLIQPLFVQGVPIPSLGNNHLFLPSQRDVTADQRQQYGLQNIVVSRLTLSLS